MARRNARAEPRLPRLCARKRCDGRPPISCRAARARRRHRGEGVHSRGERIVRADGRKATARRVDPTAGGDVVGVVRQQRGAHIQQRAAASSDETWQPPPRTRCVVKKRDGGQATRRAPRRERAPRPPRPRHARPGREQSKRSLRTIAKGVSSIARTWLCVIAPIAASDAAIGERIRGSERADRRLAFEIHGIRQVAAQPAGASSCVARCPPRGLGAQKPATPSSRSLRAPYSLPWSWDRTRAAGSARCRRAPARSPR